MPYRLYLCLAHSIPSPPMLMQHMHQLYHKWYDPLHIIMWPCQIINLDLTFFSPLPSSIGAKSCSSFTATRSIAPKPPTCPSRLQLVHQAKSCLDLLHLDRMTQCHISCAISSIIITCVSFATSPSHFHLHGICCSHICTCGLITCVSYINTISPPRVVIQLPKLHKDLSISSFLVIDDNSTKIWKLSTFGFLLLAQAILLCVNDFGQVPQT